MKRRPHTEQQVVFILKQGELGTSAEMPARQAFQKRRFTTGKNTVA
jgi:hypothetical protein